MSYLIAMVRYWNWRVPITLRNRLLVFATAVPAVLLIRGFDPLSASFSLFILGGLLHRGRTQLLAVAYVLTLLALIQTGGAGTTLALAGYLVALVSTENLLSGVSLTLSISLLALFGGLQGLEPLVLASVISLFLKGELRRLIPIYAGMAVILFLTGIPLPADGGAGEAGEVLADGSVYWPGHVDLDLHQPELLLAAPGSRDGILDIHLSSGGVRDSGQVGMIITPDTLLAIEPGESFVSLAEPEYPVRIVMSRRWVPFTHPVVHFLGAEARNE